jgi:hypothetical protein
VTSKENEGGAQEKPIRPTSSLLRPWLCEGGGRDDGRCQSEAVWLSGCSRLAELTSVKSSGNGALGAFCAYIKSWRGGPKGALPVVTGALRSVEPRRASLGHSNGDPPCWMYCVIISDCRPNSFSSTTSRPPLWRGFCYTRFFTVVITRPDHGRTTRVDRPRAEEADGHGHHGAWIGRQVGLHLQPRPPTTQCIAEQRLT